MGETEDLICAVRLHIAEEGMLRGMMNTLRVTEGMNGSTSAASRTQSPAHALSRAPHFCLSSSLPLISTHGALSCTAHPAHEAIQAAHCRDGMPSMHVHALPKSRLSTLD